MAKSIVVNLGLDPELAEALDAFVAARPGEDRGSVARTALGEYLRKAARRHGPDDAIDAVDLELAREAKRRMEDPDDEVIPYEQARAELGL